MSAIIYRITNTLNGKIYIGYTTKTLDERWKRHLIDSKNTNKNTQFINAIREYGNDVWRLEVLVEEPDTHWAKNFTELFLIRYFDSANPVKGYNGTFGGDGVIPNDKTRKKISDANRRRKISLESRQRMSEAQKRRYSKSI